MRTLFETPYASVFHDEARNLMIYKRHKERFRSPEDAFAHMSQALDTASSLQRWPRSLLMDFRDGPLRNDESFEQMMNRLVPRMIEFYKHFERSATLIRTAVGRLQMERLRRQPGRVNSDQIFQDEAEALQYLLQGARAEKR